MKDSIKIFIQQNREAFDTEKPGAQGWESVDKVLTRLKTADNLEQSVLLNRLLLDRAAVPEHLWTGISAQLDKCENAGNLERFICENRAEMDTEVPDLNVWANLNASLPKPKAKIIRMPWQQYLRRIAAALALLITGLAAGIWYADANGSNAMALADVSPEYAELEQYYKHEIKTKKTQLASYSGSQSADVLQDIDQLDRIMEDLQRELAMVPEGNRQQVVRAMIENYKSKAAILERVLGHLEENQNTGNNSKLRNEIKNM